MSQVLSSLDTGGMEVLTMMDYVDVVEEELVEGMEDADHGHDHSHEEDEAYDHSREGDLDVGGQAVFDRRRPRPGELRTTNTYGRRR